jgi:hypothetical protein
MQRVYSTAVMDDLENHGEIQTIEAGDATELHIWDNLPKVPRPTEAAPDRQLDEDDDQNEDPTSIDPNHVTSAIIVNWEDYKFDENDKQQQEDGGKGGSEWQDKFLEDFLAACADEQEQFEHV